jgi:hypothetical protein
VSLSRSPLDTFVADPVPQRARVHASRPGHIGDRAELVEHDRDRTDRKIGGRGVRLDVTGFRPQVC